MKKFYFRTVTTMKPYNNKKYWIDSEIVRPLTVEAETITEALAEYATICREKYGIEISKTAIKNKDIMYIDDKNGTPQPCGYVITGNTEFNNNYINWVKQYVELWVSIDILINAFN